MQHFKKHSDLFFDNGDTVVSTQGRGSETMSLFELHHKVLATRATGRALSGVLVLPATAPGRVDANQYFEGTLIVQPLDVPADLCVLCTGLEHGCGETGESERWMMDVCARRSQSHLVMSGGSVRRNQGHDFETPIEGIRALRNV